MTNISFPSQFSNEANGDSVYRGSLGCYRCRLPYKDWNYDLDVPDEVWAEISPTGHGGGLLCGHCLCQAIADEVGSVEVKATIHAVGKDGRDL